MAVSVLATLLISAKAATRNPWTKFTGTKREKLSFTNRAEARHRMDFLSPGSFIFMWEVSTVIDKGFCHHFEENRNPLFELAHVWQFHIDVGRSTFSPQSTGSSERTVKWVLLNKFANLTSIAVTVKSWREQQAFSPDNMLTVSLNSFSSEFSFHAAAAMKLGLFSFTLDLPVWTLWSECKQGL